MGNFLFFAAVLCGLIFSHPVHADTGCAFTDAEYVPDPKDFRLKSNYYYYRISVTPDLRFVLSLVDPRTKQVDTMLRMKYIVDRMQIRPPCVALTRTESIEVEFFNKDFAQVPVYDGAESAPASMILRDSYSKFMNLDEEGLNIQYLTPKKVIPGAPVDSHLELVPDVWVFNRCIDSKTAR